MSKVILTESYLDDIADAIRSKNGSSDTYTPSEMATAITNIPGTSTLGTKSISANGTYKAEDDDLDGYSQVAVSVSPNTGTKSITANGTYNASSDNLDGYSSVSVNVSSTVTGTKQISISSNGTTTENVADYASAEITVAVSPNVGTKSITANGTYAASSDSLDGYSSVTVSVPVHPAFALIGEKTITLAEYTNTSAEEETDTQINISNTDYLFGVVIVTCDSAITTSTEWGMSITSFNRYKSNGNVYFDAGSNIQTKGTAVLSLSQTSAILNNGAYGVYFTNNATTIKIKRKANASGMPKIRAGNYTVKVYGLSAF